MIPTLFVIDSTARERAVDPFCFVSSTPFGLLFGLRKTHQQPAPLEICMRWKL